MSAPKPLRRTQLRLLRELAHAPAIWRPPHYVTAVRLYQRSTAHRLVRAGLAELVEPIRVTDTCATRGPRELRITDAGRARLRVLSLDSAEALWGPW